jgi:mannose-6-phosphate isomerase
MFPAVPPTAPYPLLFEPILKEKVWGGRALAGLGKALPDGALIGESWELSDLASTAPSGGGGDAARSVIVNGPLAGSALADAMVAWGAGLMGPVQPATDGGFPLLVKFLDAARTLSVQVHPTPDYVAQHPEAALKAECWYVLDADPGARIWKGLRPGTTRRQLAEAVRQERLTDVLSQVPARAGDLHALPSGTVHALGAGCRVLEVQSPSDTTFRFYDWAKEQGRPSRELHVEQALTCALLEEPPPAVRLPDDVHAGVLARTDAFSVTEHRLRPGACLSLDGDGPEVLAVVAGAARIGTLALPRGAVCLVPAAAARADVQAEPQARLLRVSLARS